MMLLEHPEISLVEQLVHIFGIPGLIGAMVWAIRKYDVGQRQLQDISMDAKAAHDGVVELKVNHIAHLQAGIEKVAVSNDEAVTVLRDIKTGIAVLTDRFPRA